MYAPLIGSVQKLNFLIKSNCRKFILGKPWYWHKWKIQNQILFITSYFIFFLAKHFRRWKQHSAKTTKGSPKKSFWGSRKSPKFTLNTSRTNSKFTTWIPSMYTKMLKFVFYSYFYLNICLKLFNIIEIWKLVVSIVLKFFKTKS